MNLSAIDNMNKHNSNVIDINQIKNLIPHRDPFLFLDEIDSVDLWKSALGRKTFTDAEYFFKGHFPNFPVVPGVVLVEAMAQLATLCVAYSYNAEGKDVPSGVAFMKIDYAKFRKPVLPNDEVKIFVESIMKSSSIFRFSGYCYVKDQLVAESSFIATSTDLSKKPA